jgi:hypothetical protein
LNQEFWRLGNRWDSSTWDSFLENVIDDWSDPGPGVDSVVPLHNTREGLVHWNEIRNRRSEKSKITSKFLYSIKVLLSIYNCRT